MDIRYNFVKVSDRIRVVTVVIGFIVGSEINERMDQESTQEKEGNSVQIWCPQSEIGDCVLLDAGVEPRGWITRKEVEILED